MMKISVIISTYNQPEWLRKALWGYDTQDYKDFELVIADDGSDERTRRVIEEIKNQTKLEIVHVWHEDMGFRKTAILNKAIQAAGAEYLLFTDGDCIPRKDFLAVHINHAERGYYLSGGYCKLPMGLSETITKTDIDTQACFDLKWLLERGMKGHSQYWKLWARGRRGDVLDFLTTTKPTFNGCNVSAWKDDLLAVNGFDERMKYGGEDREVGERLHHKGIRSKQIRHRAVCLHLDHSRGYIKKEDLELNRAIRRSVKENKSVYTPYGIRKEAGDND